MPEFKAGSIRTGLAKGATVVIIIAGIFGLLLLVIYIYVRYFRKKEEEKTKLAEALSTQDGNSRFCIHILCSYNINTHVSIFARV